MLTPIVRFVTKDFLPTFVKPEQQSRNIINQKINSQDVKPLISNLSFRKRRNKPLVCAEYKNLFELASKVEQPLNRNDESQNSVKRRSKLFFKNKHSNLNSSSNELIFSPTRPKQIEQVIKDFTPIKKSDHNFSFMNIHENDGIEGMPDRNQLFSAGLQSQQKILNQSSSKQQTNHISQIINEQISSNRRWISQKKIRILKPFPILPLSPVQVRQDTSQKNIQFNKKSSEKDILNAQRQINFSFKDVEQYSQDRESQISQRDVVKFQFNINENQKQFHRRFISFQHQHMSDPVTQVKNGIRRPQPKLLFKRQSNVYQEVYSPHIFTQNQNSPARRYS